MNPNPNPLAGIRPGQRVKYLIPNGIGRNGVEWKVAAGKVVMNLGTHLVVNLGGKHGRPGVVMPDKLVQIQEAR